MKNKNSKAIQQLITWLAIFLNLLIFIHCKDSQSPNLNAVVALYSDQGCWDESVQAAEKMFEWMGLTVARVNADYINSKGLDNFSMLCIPGGDMYQYARDLSSSGKNKIINFISNGGGYIGICGGAYFAAEKVYWQGAQLAMISLALYSGSAYGPNNEIVPYKDYGMSRVNIVNFTHPITQSESSFAWMLYYWGPVLIPDNSADVTILARYDNGNQPAMLAFEYDLGRVFLIGTHPEIEEDDDRDGVDWGDELDDNGSDWELMKNAAFWCLENNI